MKTILFLKVETNGLPKTKTNTVSRDTVNKWPNLISIYYKIGKINTETKLVDINLANYKIIKPTFEINKKAQLIHNLSNEELSAGDNLIDILNKMKNDIIEHNVKIIIGHNILFDFNIVKAEIIRNNIDLDLDVYELLDTMTYKHDYEYIKLEELYFKLYGRKFRKSHKRKSLINIVIKCFENLYLREI